MADFRVSSGPRIAWLLPAAAVLLTIQACSNPADGKPEAGVSAPVPAVAATAGGARYVFNDQSSISFVGSKVTGEEEGGFASFDGEINLVGGDPSRSSASISIPLSSLWTTDPKLTRHLRSADFFDAFKYPLARFTTTEIVADGDDFLVTGNLDLHGVTKSLSFPATITVEPDRVTARAEFVIRRFDFGIAYPGRADDLIRDEVVVRLNLFAVPA